MIPQTTSEALELARETFTYAYSNADNMLDERVPKMELYVRMREVASQIHNLHTYMALHQECPSCGHSHQSCACRQAEPI